MQSVNIQRIIEVALEYSVSAFPKASPTFILLYGSTAKVLNKIRSNYGDIDINIFYNKSAHQIYGNGIWTQSSPKKIKAEYQNAIRQFDIARSLTKAESIDSLIQEIHFKGLKSSRWKVMSIMPIVVIYPVYQEINFVQPISQADYTNMSEFQEFQSLHNSLFYGFHTITNDQGEILHIHKESYESPLHIPTFIPYKK
jgi:hypothetical protein